MIKDETKPKKVMTLCLLRKGDDLLMGLKKIGLGAGFYNGFGGKVEPGETLEECVVREVKEESGLDLLEFEKMGIMFFDNIDFIAEVHIYEGLSWSGEPVETDEMAPVWLKIGQLPYDKMWISDKFWHSYFFNRIFFKGWLIFDKNHQVLDCEIDTEN